MVTAPASVIQQQFWVLHGLAPHSPAYNVPSVSVIDGPLDVAALEQAINAFLRRHPIFRAIFELDGSGRVVQRIPAWRGLSLPLVDLGTRESVEAAEAEVVKECRLPFDLSTGRPLRFKLFRMGTDSHMLAITAHHIVFDLETNGMIAEELAEEYKAARTGIPRVDVPVRTAYSDYSRWQESWMKGEERKAMEAGWEHYLEGLDPALNLPSDRLAASRSTPSEKVVPFRLEGDALRNLATVCRAERVTPFLVLLTSWALTLSRWSGQNRLSLGVPFTNRRQEAFKRTMGCFVNILPLNLDFSGNPSLREALRRVRMSMLQVHRMQEMPYYHLAQVMRSRGAATGNPLFQAGFTFAPPMRLDLDGLDVRPKYIHHGGSQLDVFATFWEESEAIVGVIEYDADRFCKPVVERIAETLHVAIGEVCEGNRAFEETTLVPDTQRNLLLVKWNDTDRLFPDRLCIHERVERQAALSPDSIAVEFDGCRLTYAELIARSRLLASQLIALGAGPETLVGLYLDRSHEMVVAMLGILQSGAAYLPLDRKFPKERLAFMIDEARPQVIVTFSELREVLPPHQANVLCLDDLPAAAPLSHLPDRFDPGNTAYVLYTSGSTGKPKGVEIPHGAVVNFLDTMRERPGMTAADTLLSVTTISFDILGLEVWLPLVTGARVVIAREDVLADGKRLAAAISDCRATVMQATPSTWRLLLEAGWTGNPSLKILCGGEAWSQDLAGPLLSRCESLWNMYGPTETTIWSAVHRVASPDSVIIGRPVANTRFYVVDSKLQLLPVGVPGELLIGGEGLARGYLNRPELTADRFIRNPFDPDGDSRVYRTGDLVRYLQDGNIEYLGRMDHQVKIRGFRIELGEIESVLGEHADVNHAVVVTRDDDHGEKQLVAYILPAEGRTPKLGELRQYLGSRLPDYMLPNRFLVLDRFPLTANGKIDRKALPAPEDGLLLKSDNQFVLPRNDGETLLTNLWQMVLGQSRVGIDDNFFDLGGNSLNMAQVHVHLCEKLDRNLPILKMFEFPTIRSMAEYLASLSDETGTPDRSKDDHAGKLKKGTDRLKRQMRRRDEMREG